VGLKEQRDQPDSGQLGRLDSKAQREAELLAQREPKESKEILEPPEQLEGKEYREFKEPQEFKEFREFRGLRGCAGQRDSGQLELLALALRGRLVQLD
jgi:hypothetical protein